jgi:hypothetical protein
MGNFPAVAVAWKLKKAFEDMKLILLLKNREVGVTGQQDMNYISSIPLFFSIKCYGASTNLEIPFIPLTDRNHYSNLKWEQTTTLGLDYGF